MARDSLQSLRAALDAVAADLAALREQLTARVGLPDPAGGNGVLTATLGAVSWQQPAAPPAAVWGAIGGTLANQTDLQYALNARALRGVANTWTAAQTFSFGAGGNVYIRPHLDSFGNGTNNGGAIYLGPQPVGATPKFEPTAAIEASWGGGAQPQVTIGVIRGGKQAWGTFYYTSGAGTGIRFGYGATQWLNLYSSGAAFSQPLTAPDFSATSDRRHKSSIRPLLGALALVHQLRPRRYWNKLNRREEVGLVAQEVRPVLPDVVSGKDGELSVSYARIVAPLVGAVQELAARIETLEARRGAAE